MTKRWTKTESFKAFGTASRNVRWSWSAISPNGDRVALVLWKDKFSTGPDGKKIYVDRDDRGHDWSRRPGNRERLEYLQHAVDHLGGIVHVVIAETPETDVRVRSIHRCRPAPELRMRVTELDRRTGEYTAVEV